MHESLLGLMLVLSNNHAQ